MRTKPQGWPLLLQSLKLCDAHFPIHSQSFRASCLRHLPNPGQIVGRHRGNRFADTLIYLVPAFGLHGVK